MRYIEVGFKCKRLRENEMALPSRLKKILSKLFVHSDQAKWGQQDWGRYKTQNIERNLEKVIKGLLSYVKLPKSNSDEDLVRWGNSQKNNPIAIDFFSQSKNMDFIVEFLEKQTNIVLSPVALNKANLPKKVIQDIRSRFSLAREEIYKSVTSYFTNAEKYSDIPEGTEKGTEKGRIVKVPAGDSEVNKILKMTGQQFKLYLSQKVGGCSLEDIQKIKQRHISQKQKVLQTQKDKDLLELENAVKRFNNLPEILTSLLSIQSNKAMRIRMQNLLGGIIPKETLNVNETEILKELIRNRAIAKNAKNLLGKLSPTEDVYNAEHLRKAEDILKVMRDPLRTGNASAIYDIAKNRISPKERSRLIKSLKKLNIYAGYALDMAIKVGYIPRMKKVQDGFIESENKKILAEFVGDEKMLKAALASSTVMRKYERLGFKPDKFFKSGYGLGVVRSWKNEIVGLLNDSEKSLLNTFMAKDKKRQGLSPKSSHEERFAQKKAIHKSMIAHLESVRGTLEADIEKRFGEGLRERMGDKAFNTLISATISDYYDSAFKSYIQGYLYKKEELSSQRKRTNYDMRTVNLRNISTFSKTAYRLGVVTIHDLHNGIIQELRDAKNSGRTKGPRSSLIEWAFEIQKYTGVKLERNMEVIREITDFLNDNSEELGIYSNRIDEETKHLGDRQDHDHKIDNQKLSDSRARVKKIETDMDRKKDREEKKMLYNIMQQVKSGSPRIQSILRIMEPGQRKKTLIENPVLREIFRQINNINKSRGLDSTKRAVWVFEHPSAGKGGQKDLFWTRDKKGNKILPPTEDENLKGSKNSQGFGKWVKTKDASSLAAENDWMQKFFMREFRHEGNRRIKGSGEYKKAMKIAKQTMYSERYNELQGLFTRQDGKFELPRNSGLNQHLQQEAIKNVQFKENRSLNEERLDNMSDQISRGFGIARVSAGWKAEGRNTAYIEQMALGGASLATMVERAQTIEQMDEVRQYISDIIPMRHLKGVEALNGNPEYTVKNESENEPPERVKGLGAFMDFHETRINAETQTREAAARLNEKEGLNKL